VGHAAALELLDVLVVERLALGHPLVAERGLDHPEQGTASQQGVLVGGREAVEGLGPAHALDHLVAGGVEVLVGQLQPTPVDLLLEQLVVGLEAEQPGHEGGAEGALPLAGEGHAELLLDPGLVVGVAGDGLQLLLHRAGGQLRARDGHRRVVGHRRAGAGQEGD
jgi:hypothetical protein